MRKSMHVSSGLIVAAALAAGCGGKGAGGDTVPSNDAPDDAPGTPAALPPGTTGFPGLDWGDPSEAVKADYPTATGDTDALTVAMAHGGRDATVSFIFTGDQLISIDVSWADTYDSMQACAEVFREVRAALAPTLGDSAEENLAAFYTGETMSATLSCNPTDDGAERAALSMQYGLAESDE